MTDDRFRQIIDGFTRECGPVRRHIVQELIAEVERKNGLYELLLRCRYFINNQKHTANCEAGLSLIDDIQTAVETFFNAK